MEFDTFHEAYPAILKDIFQTPQYRNAPRGFDSRERIGVQFRIRDASQRVVQIPGRRTNIVFNFAESLWYLSGRDDLDFIGYYAPSIRRYSTDGRRLTGTAYGPAIFGGRRPSQWANVLSQLAHDPDSKRAVLQIFDASEAAELSNPDVSCTLNLQFLLRDGALHAVGFMRANDAFRGLVSDLFSFTFLQEILAGQIGAELGSYVHAVGSMHVYATDDRLVRRVLADPAVTRPAPFTFPRMPAGDNWPYIRAVLEYEAALRENRTRLTVDSASIGLPEYWWQVLLLFEIYRRIRYDEFIDARLFGGLTELNQFFVANRWPTVAVTEAPALLKG